MQPHRHTCRTRCAKAVCFCRASQRLQRGAQPGVRWVRPPLKWLCQKPRAARACERLHSRALSPRYFHPHPVYCTKPRNRGTFVGDGRRKENCNSSAPGSCNARAPLKRIAARARAGVRCGGAEEPTTYQRKIHQTTTINCKQHVATRIDSLLEA